MIGFILVLIIVSITYALSGSMNIMVRDALTVK